MKNSPYVKLIELYFDEEEMEKTENTIVKPDCKEGWKIAACSFICVFMSHGVNNAFPIYHTEYVTKEFPNVSPTKVAWIVTLATSFTLFSGIISGRVVGYVGAKNLSLLGTVIGFISFIASSLSTSIESLVIFQGVLFGIGSGLVFSCAISVTATWFDKSLGLALGIVGSGSGLGGILMSE
ncbi:Monocarboxylate transporter 14, partial [Smittium culicis]